MPPATFLPWTVPYDWDSIAAFLRTRAIPGVELVGPGSYQRTIAIGGSHGLIEVAPQANGLSLTVSQSLGSALAPIAARISRMFDLVADAATIDAHLRRDRLLLPLVKRWPGVRLPGAWDPFELTIRAIVGQQVTVAGATTLIGRLAAAHGTAAPPGCAPLSLLFPTPAALAAAEITGMPRSRAETIRRVAAAFTEGDVAPEQLRTLRGIGAWTAGYVAMRAWNDPDAFPAGDLALRKAAGGLSERELEARSAKWRPFRAYAAVLLWRSLT